MGFYTEPSSCTWGPASKSTRKPIDISHTPGRASCRRRRSRALGGLSGGYIADHRPKRMRYLVVTQSGQALGGYALTATPERKGGTTAANTPLDGHVDGEAITLVRT